MTDVMTPEQRSRCMAAVKGKDTKPELIVRKYLFSRGLRFRLQVRKLPGSPDIVLPKYKTVIFVDGCFWHGHEGCRFFHLPKSNTEFWERKISHNKARDISNTTVLKMMGWHVIRVWECHIKAMSTRAEHLQELYNAITNPGKSYIQDHEPGTTSIAAESDSESDYGHKSKRSGSSGLQ